MDFNPRQLKSHDISQLSNYLISIIKKKHEKYNYNSTAMNLLIMNTKTSTK